MWSSSCCCSLNDSDMWALASCERLGEVADGGIAVLRLGEAQFLLAGLDRVVRFDQQRAALAAQLLDAQPGQRVQFGALRPVAGAGGLAAFFRRLRR